MCGCGHGRGWGWVRVWRCGGWWWRGDLWCRRVRLRLMHRLRRRRRGRDSERREPLSGHGRVLPRRIELEVASVVLTRGIEIASKARALRRVEQERRLVAE